MEIQFRILALDTRVCSALNVFVSEGGRDEQKNERSESRCDS